jgi:hypothetical protein
MWLHKAIFRELQRLLKQNNYFLFTRIFWNWILTLLYLLFIKNILGRSEMTPYFVNQKGLKDFISFHIINEIYDKGVSKFQIIVTGLSSFILQISYEKYF